MKILITGDFFVEHPERITIDYSVKRLMTDCDYRIVNLEGPITWTETIEEPKKSGPRLKQPDAVISLLEDMGTNMLTMANNHLMDYGVDGFQQTKTILRGRYVLSGCGKWEDAYKLHIIEKEGQKVGILNFCEMQCGMLYDEWTQGGDAVGCAWINHPRVNKLILDSKEKVDYLIAIVHAGVEMVEVPLPEWRDRYREMIDMGCDAVIAHHPHVVQGYEIYKSKPIAYSLGNFIFQGGVKMNNEGWNIGALAILELRQGAVRLTLEGCQLKNNYLNLTDTEEWKEKIDQLCQYLNKDYMTLVNDCCQRLRNNYWNLFAMGGLFAPEAFSMKNLARIPLHRYDHIHILNNIQCESHRMCFSRALMYK
jgi:poly-gamma-glutamate synthesis protein (capsule biosynthesis protein)